MTSPGGRAHLGRAKAARSILFWLRWTAPAGWERQHGDKDASSQSGEALLAPARNRRKQGKPLDGEGGRRREGVGRVQSSEEAG